jgi:hypothetical protein
MAELDGYRVRSALASFALVIAQLLVTFLTIQFLPGSPAVLLSLVFEWTLVGFWVAWSIGRADQLEFEAQRRALECNVYLEEVDG